MKVTKYYCDRCGKEITGGTISINPVYNGSAFENGFVYTDTSNRDYCQECTEEIYVFMMANSPKKQIAAEPKKEEKPKPAKKVDEGKVMALKKAGWSHKKIAEEMGCSDSFISRIVSRYSN